MPKTLVVEHVCNKVSTEMEPVTLLEKGHFTNWDFRV